ncbi:type VI secretion system-associated FHA domain protein TagH [Pseudomonas sp. MWU15-20650]|uniref:type VI secretion system-associated FHA domain protein TagH n=1 Tax=Pseudomonas sp. MWU15-20650 TaxID=2933107 RepID=UPI00200F7E18|nr:type VI secretion system-associated FHA domain protein TagH [Pseudomonas sp. MWU15-20650]
MQLVFEVCEGEGGRTVSPRKVFDGTGGVIGRGSGCDWVIPDPSRLLSSHHGLVAYREGRYFLTDISSNGIGVAGSAERLRKGQARLIGDGEVFDLGAVAIRARLTVALQPSCEQGLGAGVAIPDDAFLSLDPLLALDLDHQQQTTSAELEALSKVDGEPGLWTDRHAADREHVALPRRVEPVVEAIAVHSVAMTPPTDEVFWAQFAAALGIDLDTLDKPGREALAIKVARLFRLGIEGLQQSLHTRDELIDELGPMSVATLGVLQNPLKACADTDAALAAMLGAGALGQLPAERAIVQAHRGLQAHQVALLAACRSAIRSARAAFAPGQLLWCFESQGKPPRFFTDGGHWRAYQRHYQRLVTQEQFTDRPLDRDFAKAYEEQVRLISTLHVDYPG